MDPPESKYYFSLDPDTLEDGGGFAALSRSLKITFETWRHGPGAEIQLTECGHRLDNLVAFLKDTLWQHIKSDADRKAFKEAWLERLIIAAKNTGGKAAPRGRKRKDCNHENDSTVVNNHILPPPSCSTSDTSSSMDIHPSKWVKQTTNPIIIESGSSDTEHDSNSDSESAVTLTMMSNSMTGDVLLLAGRLIWMALAGGNGSLVSTRLTLRPKPVKPT